MKNELHFVVTLQIAVILSWNFNRFQLVEANKLAYLRQLFVYVSNTVVIGHDIDRQLSSFRLTDYWLSISCHSPANRQAGLELGANCSVWWLAPNKANV